jgi:hypothetical protein
LPEPDVANTEFFLAQVQLFLPVLGFAFTQPRPASTDGAPPGKAAQKSPVVVMNPVGTHAQAQEIDGEFVVSKGSTARKQSIQSRTSYKTLRVQIVQEGQLAEGSDPGFYVFAEDVPFSSPSAAAAVVFGGNQHGPMVWKTRDSGQTYRDLQMEKLK